MIQVKPELEIEKQLINQLGDWGESMDLQR